MKEYSTQNKELYNRKKLKFKIIGLVLSIILVAFSYLLEQYEDNYINTQPDLTVNTNTSQPENNYFQMHVIDVGQGDSIFVKCGSKNILIDGGENGKGTIVAEYLEKLNVTKLDMVIATHPHSDHIGGLSYVMNNIETEAFMMSDTPNELVPTSKIYEKLLNCISENEIQYVEPKSGDVLYFDDVKMEILWDGSQGTDLNNTSVVVRFVYKNTSFISGGDAEKAVEENIIDMYGYKINSDVLKVNHHGSDTSSCQSFVEAVNPTYAVMSLGADNSYGFPHQQTLATFRNRGVTYYRTDLQGSVVFISDGNNIGVKTSK